MLWERLRLATISGLCLAALAGGCGDDEMAPAPDGGNGNTPQAGSDGTHGDPSMTMDMPGPTDPQPTTPDPTAGDSLQVCYDLCQAQQTAEEAGNCVRLGLDNCKALCDGAEGGRCWDRLVALNSCQLTGEFSCGFFSAESDADCDTELSAYQSCVGL